MKIYYLIERDVQPTLTDNSVRASLISLSIKEPDLLYPEHLKNLHPILKFETEKSLDFDSVLKDHKIIPISESKMFKSPIN